MSVNVNNEIEVRGIKLTGDLDADSASETRGRLEEIIGKDRVKLVIDLCDVDFVDSSGLSVLVTTLKHARGAGGDVVLANLKPQLKSLIQLTRLHRIFEIQ
jgi:anti-sigma B factor antagonist